MDTSNPFDLNLAISSKYMKPIGHVPKSNFFITNHASKSHESLDAESLLEKVKLVEDLGQVLERRKQFKIYEDNFKNTLAQIIKDKLSFNKLRDVCSKYNENGISEHNNKSKQQMGYFLHKKLSNDDARACAFAISFYTGSTYGTINRGASMIARQGNGEMTSGLEDKTAEDASIIMYYMILGLSHIDFYWGTVTRAINMNDNELDQYFEGALISWIQFSSSKRGDTPAAAFAESNTVFTIYSLTGRRIKDFSNFPDEDEVLFMPHSSFLVTHVTRSNNQNRIFMRQVELGLCEHTILWVDDNIFDATWENKKHMEKAGTLGGKASVHFIPKINTEMAIVFLKSAFGQRLKGKPNFRIITDMNRYNENPSNNAGARLLLEVRKLEFDCLCLVFTSDKAKGTQIITTLLNPTQQKNIQVTTSVQELEKFVSFK